MKKFYFLIFCVSFSFLSAAQTNNALNFDGVNDYVDVGSTNVLASATALTIEAWYYPTVGSRNWSRILDFGNGSTTEYMFLSSSQANTGIPRFAMTSSGGSGESVLSASSALALNTWTHIAVTLTGTTATMYINGTQVAQNTSFNINPADLGATTNNWLGRSQYTPDAYLQGNLDEVRIWDVARTATEIANNKDTELVGNETGLLAYYNFNQGTAGGTNTGVTSLTDETSGSNDGTLSNFALTGTSSNWVDGSGNGVTSSSTNNALNFDGSNDIVNLGTVIPASSSYTKEAWIYPENTSGARNIISSQRSPFWINNGTLSSSNNFAQAGSISINSPTAISINTWTHVAVTWDGTTMKLYVNGSEVAQQTGHAAYQSSQDISLGTYVGGSIFDGNMDEVRIWDVARTASEITNNKDTELVGNETGLLAYYNFNQGTAGGTNTGVTTLDDSTTNNNDGTLNNFALTGTSSNWVDGSGNGVTSTTSSINTVLDFGPNAADVTVGSVPTIEDFTLEFNFKPDGAIDFENIFSTFGQNGNTGGMRLETNSASGGNLNLYGDYGFHALIPSSESLNNQWYHIAIVGDKTNDRFKIYLDGVEKVDVAKTTGWPASFTNLILAKGFNGDANRDYNGQMDEFRLWDVALDQATIQSRKDASLVGNESDLRIYYNFEEGTPNANNTAVTTVVNQAASGGFNGTVNGLAKTGNESNWVSSDLSLSAASNVNTVLDFGDLDSTELVNSGELAIGAVPDIEDFTLEFNFKPDGEINYENIFSTNGGSGLNNGLRLETSANWPSGHLNTFGNGYGGYPIIPLSEDLNNQWYHIAFVGDKTSGRFKIYLDGVEKVNVAKTTGWPTNFPDLILGKGYSASNERDYNGQMDEFRLWDVALDQATIQSRKDASLVGNESDLRIYYNFEEGTPNGNNSAITTVINQAASGGFNGTVNGLAKTGNESNWVSSDLSLSSTPVVTKTALNFDGTNDYVDATGSSANLLPQGNDPFTVEYSVKTSQTSLGNVVSWGIKSGNQRASFGVRNNRAAFIGQFNDYTGVKFINDDRWHNIAITYSGGPTRALKFYVDGVLDATRTSNTMNIPNDDLLLGVQPTNLNENFDGTADNIRIWDKELTASEVAQYSGADIPSNTTNLVAYFNFEEAEGNVDNSATGADVTSVTDLTGNYNGTLINFARTGNSSNWVNRIFNEWEGTTDSDWATASNWSTGAVPVSTDNVLIPNTATQPLISSSTTANIRSITLATNTVLTVEGILNVDIRIVNDGQILFKSNSSKTGQLDALEGVISGNGTEKVERYIPAKRTFRLLSSAVGGQSFADAWQQDTHITGAGGAANGFDVTSTNNPSLFTFDNSIDPQFSSTESGLGWQPVTSTSNLIVAGTPYRLMVRGDRSVPLDSNSSPATVTTLSAEGDMHTGSFSPSLATAANNFSFVGNPYQAVVDINATTRSNLTNFIYVWDASIDGDNTNGGFVTVPIPGSATPNPFSSDATQYVAPGQAFFVQNTASGNGSITFEEADKATAQTQQTPFSVDSEFYINSRLYKTSALNNSEMESDAIGLRFNTNYTTLGSDEDAGKLGNPGENYLIFNNGLKAIDFQNMPTNGHVVELALVNYEDNDYHLTFDLDHKPEDLKVYLNDTYLETQTEITTGLSYNFMVDANISESVDPFRFNISFEDVSLSNVDFNLDALRVYPNPVVNRLEISLPDQVELIEVRLIDLLGNQLLTNNEASLELGNLAAGIYLVQIRTDEGEITKKIIKQ